ADDIQVSCDFMESCILPCSFPPGDEVVIHWMKKIQKTTKDTQAHSYYHNQDQLGLQDQHFRGRTSLFKDQISRGTASIRLTGVEVQDEGRYKCYTSTISDKKESYINLNVDAPIHKVDIQQVENRITCSSEGIYPQPELTWSTSPLSDVSLENNPTVQQTEQLLYNINSSLIASVTDLVYSCTVSTRTNKRAATLFKLSKTDIILFLSTVKKCSKDKSERKCHHNNRLENSLLNFTMKIFRFFTHCNKVFVKS
uniref:Ig-like domain-containing protein n=1 Tax=Sander lucioperca TaxID=283035 RepID=A0A8D0AWT8_SANLU